MLRYAIILCWTDEDRAFVAEGFQRIGSSRCAAQACWQSSKLGTLRRHLRSWFGQRR